MMLRPNDSWSTCIPQGIATFLHYASRRSAGYRDTTRFRSSAVISSASDEHPGVARPGPGGDKKRGRRASHHEECEAMGSCLLPCAATVVSLLAVWCLSGAAPRGQPWTSTVTRPHGCNGLSARRMAVLWTFREPSLCRHGRRELLRNAWLDFTPSIPATACQQ